MLSILTTLKIFTLICFFIACFIGILVDTGMHPLTYAIKATLISVMFLTIIFAMFTLAAIAN